jgi:hypothetical protein
MKMSTQLAIFFVAFNALALVLTTTGVAADIGINAETGNPDALNDFDNDISLGNNVGGTLFGMYNRLTQQAGQIFYTYAAGFAILRAYLPNIWIDAFLSPLAGLVVTKDLIALARGTDL